MPAKASAEARSHEEKSSGGTGSDAEDDGDDAADDGEDDGRSDDGRSDVSVSGITG